MVEQSTKYGDLRQYISAFVTGEAGEALVNTIADEAQRAEDLSVSVTDQLTISTASGIYLDRRLADKAISRPGELGMDDLSFRNIGIQINATKEVTSVIHTVLSVFYGEDAVRAWTQSTVAAPYAVKTGMDLELQFEDGVSRVLTIKSTDFVDLGNATAAEMANVITRFILGQGVSGLATTFTDPDTGLVYVRVYGSARGPYSTVKVMGGRLQNLLEFPLMRGTELQTNDTHWEITKNFGDTIRFRWVGGSMPALDQVYVDDRVMIYGSQFETQGSSDLIGTWTVTNVRPPNSAGSEPTTGWFEIQIPNLLGLSASAPDMAAPSPPPPPVYSWHIAQGSYDDLKFFQVKKLAPYSQPRYALAFEPSKRLLKVYMPATTTIVHRTLIGASHLHQLYSATNLNGSYGLVTAVSDRTISYPQGGYDNYATGGTLTVGTNVIPIEYVNRENGCTTVICSEPHGIGAWDSGKAYAAGDVAITGSTAFIGYRCLVGNTGQNPDTSPTYWEAIDPFYPFQDTQGISVTVGQAYTDSSAPFLGPYMVDTEANYAITNQACLSRTLIFAGEQKQVLFVQGSLPNTPGQLMFDLGKTTQEGPVRYLASITSGGKATTTIRSIRQSGTSEVTVITTGLHGAIPGSQITIGGTSNFNDTWTVGTVLTNTSFTFQKPTLFTITETVGTVTVYLLGASSTLTLDQGYTFKQNHGISAEINLLSASAAYTPDVRGRDYSTYITGTAEARAYAVKLIEQITALGIILEIIVVYPDDIGLGNEGGSASLTSPPTSDKVLVWGDDSIQ